jgi:hypothetical protein
MTDARVRTVGGTLASKILGLSKWGGPLAAYYELTQAVSADENDSMDRGSALEESVLQLLLEREGYAPGALVRPAAPVSGGETMPYAHARVDAWIEGLDVHGSDPFCLVPELRTLIEAKTLALEQMGEEWGVDGTDRIATEYQIQGLWYHGVCRAAGMKLAEEALVPVLVGPETELALAARMVERTGRPLKLEDINGTRMELRVYRVAWDAELFSAMRARVFRFIRNHVERGVPPEPGDGDLTDRDLKAVARGISSKPGEVLDFGRLHPVHQATVADLLEAVRERKRWKELEEQAVVRVQLLMGTAEEIRGLDGGARVTWSTIKGGSRRFELREPRR